MEWGINDSLKARSYGQKNDYDSKMDKISTNSNYKQYYPQRADGNVDEWQALSQQQQELYKKSMQEEKNQIQQQK